ncbi:MAG: beta-galactosidase [Clostridium sp.]
MEFEIKGKKFYKNGEEVRLISGAIHYFRMFKEQYEDRLLKLKACGFNTVETYVPWNLHEPKEGQFVFDGFCDFNEFIKAAERLDLMVIVRPGPFICAEWEMGGLPGWLLKDKNIKLRCMDEKYLTYVDRWFDEFIPRLVPHICSNGGPVIAVQVENEYGSYGNDKAYLEYIKEGLIRRGVDSILFTSDGPTDYMLKGGTLEDVYKTVNFGSKSDEAFDKLEEHQKDMPLMCMEYWIGWFDHWEGIHHKRASKDVVENFETMLERGANVNFYMFHGGTNFGFMNGANFTDKYVPTITSYDYDSILTEAGDTTEKYLEVRALMEKYFGKISIDIPKDSVKKAYEKVQLSQCCSLFENLDNLVSPIKSTYINNMEAYGQEYGYTLYSKVLEGPLEELPLSIDEVHDRAQVFINGEEAAVYYRNREPQLMSDKFRLEKAKLMVKVPKEGLKLDILVENMGRINYGPYIKDFKGITEGVRLQGQFLHEADVWNLEMQDLSKLQFKDVEKVEGPAFFKGKLTIDKVEDIADTFIALENFNKGVVFINGFNLGRYWNVGPQLNLYVPYPLLKCGENEIIVFEQHGCDIPEVRLEDKALWK